MDSTCIETNEKPAFGMEAYFRNMSGKCWFLEHGRNIPEICQTYDTIRIPDDLDDIRVEAQAHRDRSPSRRFL